MYKVFSKSYRKQSKQASVFWLGNSTSMGLCYCAPVCERSAPTPSPIISSKWNNPAFPLHVNPVAVEQFNAMGCCFYPYSPHPRSPQPAFNHSASLLNTYHVPDTILEAGDRAVNKSSGSLQFQCRRNKHIYLSKSIHMFSGCIKSYGKHKIDWE